MAEIQNPAGNGAVPIPAEQSQRIAEVAGVIKSGRGGARPGAGRPKSNAAPGVASPAKGETKPPEITPSPADIEFCKKIAETGLEILDRVVTGKIVKEINLIGDDSIRSKANLFISEIEIGAADKRLVGDAAGALAAKYPFLSAYAPEAVIVGWATSYGMRVTNVIKQLKLLRIEVMQMKSRQAPDADANKSSAI